MMSAADKLATRLLAAIEGAERGAVDMSRRCAADRRIVAEHRPELTSVEWPHDQTGKGEAWVCPRCQNAENDSQDWHPPIGEAGEFPHENFITSYVLAPCITLRLLAEGYGITEETDK